MHDIAGRNCAASSLLLHRNIVAYGIGAPLIGKVNDWLGVAENPSLMRYSLLLCPLACAASALLLWRGSRRLAEQLEVVGKN